jgi:hypothetical protein
MADHRIFPHGAPTELVPGLWQVEGSLPFPLKRNMTIYRQPDGSLVIYSAVALDAAGLKSLEALGEPSWMIVSHPMHVMDAPFYKSRYPRMRVAAPKDAAARLAGMKIDGTPDEAIPDLGLRHHLAPGMKYSEIVLDVPVTGGRALVFTDLVCFGGPPGLMMRLLGPPGGVGVPRIVKFRQVARKPEVRTFLRAMAETPDLRLVAVAHGPAALEGAADKLRIAADGV